MSSSTGGGGLADIGSAEAGARAEEEDGVEEGAGGDTTGGKPRWLVDLNRVLARNSKDVHSRFFQLATVRVPEGGGPPRPACRTVVFRGFLPDTEVGRGVAPITTCGTLHVLPTHVHLEPSCCSTGVCIHMRVFEGGYWDADSRSG
jgi:hypothetical protein